jgi:hypothetical protein
VATVMRDDSVWRWPSPSAGISRSMSRDSARVGLVWRAWLTAWAALVVGDAVAAACRRERLTALRKRLPQKQADQ